MRLHLPRQLPFFLAMVLSSAFPVTAQHDLVGTEEQAKHISPKFIETSSALGINFRNMASHSSRKYLIETMGSGVALFDYDNDGRLDIFVVNGAPLTDPTPKGAIPQKTGPKYWNRLYHQKQDGTFQAMGIDEKGMGFHAFRRFRKTWLRAERCQEDINNFWMGHQPETMSELYSRMEFELKPSESVSVSRSQASKLLQVLQEFRKKSNSN